MLRQIIGAALGGAASKQAHKDPVKGAIIGAATLAISRRFLPARYAALGASLAAAYLTKKLADRAMEREQEMANARGDGLKPVKASIPPVDGTPPADPSDQTRNQPQAPVVPARIG